MGSLPCSFGVDQSLVVFDEVPAALTALSRLTALHLAAAFAAPDRLPPLGGLPLVTLGLQVQPAMPPASSLIGGSCWRLLHLHSCLAGLHPL